MVQNLGTSYTLKCNHATRSTCLYMGEQPRWCSCRSPPNSASRTTQFHQCSTPAELPSKVFFFFLPFTNYQTVKRHKYLLAKPTVRDSMAMNCLLVCYQLSCCSAQWEVADFEWGSWTQSSSNWAFLSLVYVVKAEANPWVTPTQAVICHQIAVLLNEKPVSPPWLLPFSMQHNMDNSRFWALAQFLPSVLKG